jgi:hypothetical protein
VWGLRTGLVRIPALLQLASRLGLSGRSGSLYEPVRKLFEQHLMPQLPDEDQAACARYFDVSGAYTSVGAEARRAHTGRIAFQQGYSRFRDPQLGEERHFLVRVAEAALRAESLVRQGATARQLIATPLQQLLEAQAAVARELPYWPYDPRLPALDEVYVEPWLTFGDVDNFIARSTDQVRLLSVFEAVGTGGSILLTGGPGGGKTTLAVRTAVSLTDNALSSAAGSPTALALYLPAQLLIGPHSFPQLIAAGLTSFLSGYLSRSIDDSTLFQPLPAGYRWVLFIDGLDEVANVTERRRLLAQIEYNITRSPFQFVLTSRELGQDLDRLRHRLTHLQILPLFPEQTRRFVELWLSVEGAANPKQSAAELLESVRKDTESPWDSSNDFASTPLLLTIFLITRSQNVKDRVRSIVELYEEFVKYLLFGRQTYVCARANVQTTFGTVGAEAMAEGLFAGRRDLCAFIAWRLMEADHRDLVDIALDWIADNFVQLAMSPHVSSAVESVLLDTGLVIRNGSRLIFFHRTLQEYLAAPLAAIDAPVLDYEWRNTEFGRDRGLYTTFRLLAWAGRNTSTPLVESFLARGTFASYERLSKLVKNGLSLDESTVEAFLAFFADKRDWLTSDEGYSDIRQLGVLCNIADQHESVVERLIATIEEGISLEATVLILVRLWQIGYRDVVKDRLLQLAASDDPWRHFALGRFYLRIGREDVAQRIADGLIQSRCLPGVIAEATRLLHAAGAPERARQRLAELLQSTDVSWAFAMTIAGMLCLWGASHTALTLIRRRLRNEPCASRGSNALVALEFDGLGWREGWVYHLFREERSRLLCDSKMTLEMRKTAWTIEGASERVPGSEWGANSTVVFDRELGYVRPIAMR